MVKGLRVFLTFHTENKKINIYKRCWKTGKTLHHLTPNDYEEDKFQ